MGVLVWQTAPEIEVNAPPGSLVLALGALGAGVVLLASRRKRVKKGEDAKGCYGYRLQFHDSEEAGRLARVIEERAQRGYADYIVMSTFTQSGYGNILLICGSGASLVKEKEIFETLVETLLDKVRIERVAGVPRDLLKAARLASKGRGRGDPSLVGWVSNGIEPSRPASVEPLVVLGRRVDKPLPKPVALVEEDIEGHVGVYGSTGTGKSTTLAKIARQVASKWQGVVVLDWTGEYSGLGGRRLDPSRGEVLFDPFRILDEPGGAQSLVDIISGSLGLSDPQAFMLQTVLEEKRPSSLDELFSSIVSWPEESKWDREVKKGLIRRLGFLKEAFRVPGQDGLLEHGVSGLLVVDVSRIEGVRARRAFALLLAAALYYTVRRHGGGRILVVFDEAQNVFMGGEGVFGEMMAESRKFGLSIAYATQAPSLVPDNILVNTNTKIVHALRSQRDKTAIAQSMSLSDDMVYLLDKMARGEAIVQAPSIPEPVLVKIDP